MLVLKMTQTVRRTFSAKCPHCSHPFHYTEVTFVDGINDIGHWEVQCFDCESDFSVQLNNAYESYAEYDWQIHERFDHQPLGETSPMATDIVAHNIERKKTSWHFDCDAFPLYLCQQTGSALDTIAYTQLNQHAQDVETAWRSAEQYLLAGGDGGREHVLVSVDVPCDCGASHLATFYAEKRLGAGSTPLVQRCLLADVQRASFASRLNGLYSKTEIMQFLEKLVIRWHLTSDQILIAAPFVGHQFMGVEDKRKIWDWLIQNLDPRKTTLLTRKATFADFKKTLTEDGVDYEELKGYGLEDRLISSGVTKQNFHAKFYAGLSEEVTEVLSGSANLLRGPSIENISFSQNTGAEFAAHYLAKLKAKISLTSVDRRQYEIVRQRNGLWSCGPLAAAEAPWRKKSPPHASPEA
jgi:hypothetical protein